MKLLAIASFLISFAPGLALAEDGIVVHFTIKKTIGTETDTYTNGVLMRPTEASTFRFPGQYELRLEGRSLEGGKENLVVTLKDISSGEPEYAGSGSATMKIGDSLRLDLHTLPDAETRYDVFLDTSYGKIPDATKQ